jgi:hypothetical protein
MAVNTDFNDQRWAEHKQNWCDFWDHKLDRPMVILENYEPTDKFTKLAEKYPGCGCPAHFSLDEPAENVVDFFQAQVESVKHYGDSWPKWFVNFGPGSIAGFLGSEVKVRPDTIWFEAPEGFDFEKFDPTFDENNKWYKRTLELTDLALEKWQDKITVSISDIGENFDILLAFRSTQELLMDLYDCPDRLEGLIQKLTELWFIYYQRLVTKILDVQGGTSAWAPMWSPGKSYILQSDFSYMIGPEMFDKFVLPDLKKCCDYLDHVYYHLDGCGQLPHLDSLLAIENLHGVQWMPGEGGGEIEEFTDVLKKIIDAGKLTQVYASPESALKIKEKIGAKGFVFHIIHKGMKEAEANDLVNKLYE